MSHLTSHPHHCLNCEQLLQDAYCPHCGQPASTHRYSLKSLFAHDIVHSLWHVDKSILRTAWNILRHPGTEARKNIAGKRAGQYPIITLVLLITALHLAAIAIHDANITSHFMLGPLDASEWMHHNAKWVIISLIPLFAACGKICFRKPRYNYAEHVVALAYIYCGTLMVMAGLSLLALVIPVTAGLAPARIFSFLLLGYIGYAYWNLYKPFYKFGGWLWRFIINLVMAILFIVLIILAVASLASGYKKDFELHLGAISDSTAGKH